MGEAMTLARRRFRRRHVEGVAERLDWLLEEELVWGLNRVLGVGFGQLRGVQHWRFEWDRWRATIMPKALRYRPGVRPFALYVIGEIPRRPLWKTPPAFGCEFVDVADGGGATVRHWVGLPAEYQQPEAEYLRDLGIVDEDEFQRHLEWVAEPNPDCDRCLADRYPLEAALHE